MTRGDIDPEEALFSSSAEEDDELDTTPRPMLRFVAAILVVTLFILMTNLFFSLVLNR